jgi:hypothetical protein
MTERDEATDIRDEIDREHGKCQDNSCAVCPILGKLDARVIVAQARCWELGI